MTKPGEIETVIRSLFREIYLGQHPDGVMPDLEPGSILLETGLDSLGFAILVTRLEDELGYDPFSLAAEAYYPQTFGELVAFYVAHCPR